MEYREYGNSGIKISIIGFGAGQIGGDTITENEIDILLNRVLDSGINLIDTARSYGASEERIGRVLSKRRSEFHISTKVGYGIEGVADWSFDAVTKGIEEALTKLKTDYIDIVHLHSCPLETLLRGEVIDALEKSKSSGKILIAAYSGENEA